MKAKRMVMVCVSQYSPSLTPDLPFPQGVEFECRKHDELSTMLLEYIRIATTHCYLEVFAHSWPIRKLYHMLKDMPALKVLVAQLFVNTTSSRGLGLLAWPN
jgi:hypothetical protein